MKKNTLFLVSLLIACLLNAQQTRKVCTADTLGTSGVDHCFQCAPAEKAKGGKEFFNGKDLGGWKVPKGNDQAKWYQVVDGVLQIRSGPKKKGSVLWTEKKYRDFEIEFDFRFGEGTVDSGVHLRTQDQIQIGISGSLKRDMTCSPYIPGKGYPVEAKDVAKLLKAKDWNRVKIRAIGPKYTVWLQGKEVMNYESSSAKPEGPIGIQLHGNRNMGIDFKSLVLKEL